MDEARTGPTWLGKPEIAAIVQAALNYTADHLHYYDLSAWVIMHNHVHMLVWPLTPCPKFMKTLKGFTAREANKLLGRTGEPFWQHESYDHWVRGQEEFNRIVSYIECNPVRAGLCRTPEEYPWSSAYRGASLRLATPAFVPA